MAGRMARKKPDTQEGEHTGHRDRVAAEDARVDQAAPRGSERPHPSGPARRGRALHPIARPQRPDPQGPPRRRRRQEPDALRRRRRAVPEAGDQAWPGLSPSPSRRPPTTSAPDPGHDDSVRPGREARGEAGQRVQRGDSEEAFNGTFIGDTLNGEHVQRGTERISTAVDIRSVPLFCAYPRGSAWLTASARAISKTCPGDGSLEVE